MEELGAIRVLDGTESIAGGYCAKLLSQSGAEVVKVERPGGDPLRSWSCAGPGTVADSALFAYLHFGQSSVVAEGADLTDLTELVAGADVVISDPAGIWGDPAGLAGREPGLVVVSITPYGLHGPYAGRPASELTVQADSGALAVRGHPGREPFQAGGQSTEWLAGAYGAVAVVAALRGRDLTGRGELVDLSWAEVASLSCTLFADVSDAVAGRPDLSRRPARSLETPSIEPTADGYVGFNTNTAQQFNDFLVLIGRTDLLADDPSWVSLGTRIQRWDEWNAIVHEWTRARTTAEIVSAAAELRIPVAPVGDAEEVVALDHLRRREVFVADPSGAFVVPRRPWIVDGEPPPRPAPPPRLGEHTGRLPPHTRGRGTAADEATAAAGPALAPADGGPAAAPAAGAPAAEIRVLDLTTWWAGPSASGLLAALGADVIHVESTGHPDGMRMTGGALAPRDRWWELSGFFLSVNTNKRGLTLDLATAEGRDLLLRLVARVDVVMDNFSPRVLEQFELGWEVIHAANPQAIMVRMPAFGLDGPWRDRPGFAQTMEQMTGLAWLTGHIDDQPRIQRGPCDPNAGMHAALATLLAVRRRDRTGAGCLVEVPMVEAALAIAAESVIEWTAYGNRLGRDGNRSPRACPQGVYACRGIDQWLAVSVTDDAQWRGLALATENPAWADDRSLASWAARRSRHDELDAGLAGWAAELPLPDAVAALVSHGVPAAPARDPRRASEHPQFVARRFYETVEHPVAGPVGVPTQPFRLAGIDHWVRSAAPTIGQHNAPILAALGIDEAAREDLSAAGVIGTRPRRL